MTAVHGPSRSFPPALHGRSFLAETDVSVDEWHALLRLAAWLKRERRVGRARIRFLTGLGVVLVFEKTSTRTRCAFEVAAQEEGAHVTYLDPTGSQLGHKETVRDTARVLGRLYDGIEFRGAAHHLVEELADAAGVPVWNGLTDAWHPTQSLCDMLTMTEHARRPGTGVTFAFLGDARNNVAHSLLVAGAMMGMDVRMVAPAGRQPDQAVVAVAQDVARGTGAALTVTDDVEAGVRGADFVYTDVWLSMGEPEELWAKRIEELAPYAVSMSTLRATGNPDVAFMHCLPAFHNDQTTVGRAACTLTGRTSLEVDDEVFESRHSIVFDQAENRLHTAKAVLVATLGRSPGEPAGADRDR